MFYEKFADSYDEMIDWAARLQVEKESLIELLKQSGAKRVLDVGCGTGIHSILLQKNGFEAIGVDNNAEMLDEAFKNARKHGIQSPKFHIGEFTELSKVVRGEFDAVICLGNSLPHLVDDNDINTTLRECLNLLRPGGLFVLQLVNFDHYLDTADSAVAVSDGMRRGQSVTFRRHYEFKGTKVIFHVSIFERGTRELLETYSSPLNAIRRELLETYMEKIGFSNTAYYRDMALTPLAAGDKSLLCVAYKPRE